MRRQTKKNFKKWKNTSQNEIFQINGRPDQNKCLKYMLSIKDIKKTNMKEKMEYLNHYVVNVPPLGSRGCKVCVCGGGDKDTQQRKNKQEIIYTTDTYKN